MNISLVAIAVTVALEERKHAYELKQMFAEREKPKTGFFGKIKNMFKNL